MKKKYSITIIVLIILCTGVLSLWGNSAEAEERPSPKNIEAPKTQPKAKKPLVQKDTVDKVTLKAEYLPIYQAGREANLKLSLINMGSKAIFYYCRAAGPILVDLQVKDSKGKSVPFTRWGKRTMRTDAFFSTEFKSLATGKMITSKINLMRCFDLTVPGDYVVSAKWFIIKKLLNRVEEKKQKPKMLELKFKIKIIEPQ